MKKESIGVSKRCNNEYWPPVERVTHLPSILKELMGLDCASIRATLKTKYEYNSAVMDVLGIIYSLFFNYRDSPKHLLKQRDMLDIYKVKVTLDEILVDELIKPDLSYDKSVCNSVETCCQYLESLVATNTGFDHTFFDYVKSQMTNDQ